METADFFQIGIFSSDTELLPQDQWPSEWTTPLFKTYPRLPRIHLPAAKPHDSVSIFHALETRRSKRNFNGEPLTAQEISALLYYSAGILPKKYWLSENQPRRFFPSAGALYPTEIYPLVLVGTNEIAAGLYHYAVREHALEILRPDITPAITERITFYHKWAREASIVLLLSAVLWRTEVKYREAAGRLILLEIGHIAQNFYLISAALGLACCAIAGLYHEQTNEALGLAGNEETVLYGFLVGREKNK